MSPEKLIVISVSFHSEAVLERMIQSLPRSFSGSLRAVVVDNAASLRTRNWATAANGGHGLRVDYIAADGNLGYAGGVNLGLRQADEDEYVVIANPDIHFSAGSLDALVSTASRVAGACVVGPRLVDMDGTEPPSLYGRPTLVSVLLSLAHLSNLSPLGRWSALSARQEKPQTVAWVSGACMVLPPACVSPLPEMDERLFMYMEDVALCDEIRRRGGQVIWDRDAMVWHEGGHSTKHDVARTYVQTRLSKMIYFTHYRGRGWGSIVGAVFAAEAMVKWLFAIIVPSRRYAASGPRQVLGLIWSGAWHDPIAAQDLHLRTGV